MTKSETKVIVAFDETYLRKFHSTAEKLYDEHHDRVDAGKYKGKSKILSILHFNKNSDPEYNLDLLIAMQNSDIAIKGSKHMEIPYGIYKMIDSRMSEAASG